MAVAYSVLHGIFKEPASGIRACQINKTASPDYTAVGAFGASSSFPHNDAVRCPCYAVMIRLVEMLLVRCSIMASLADKGITAMASVVLGQLCLPFAYLADFHDFTLI